MNKNAWIILGIAVVILAGLFIYSKKSSVPVNLDSNSTTTIPVVTPSDNTAVTSTDTNVKNYGQVTVALNQKVIYPGGYIKIISVDEDSRCPSGVQCIWAGTVKTTLEYSLNGVMKKGTLELNKSITRGNEKITLVEVAPANLAGKKIIDADYRFTLNVTKTTSANSNPVTPVATGGCYVGGCSSQVCSDTEGAISTCEYKAEYACYKTAKCERQSNGQCGWTSTSELNQCLANAR